MLTANEVASVQLAKVRNIPVIDLPAGGYGFLDRGMTKAQKGALYAAGYNAVVQHLANAA
jgi:hypothetical protein